MNKKIPKKYTREWFVEMGRIGGQKTKDLHGRKHFIKIPSLKKRVDNLKEPIETSIK